MSWFIGYSPLWVAHACPATPVDRPNSISAQFVQPGAYRCTLSVSQSFPDTPPSLTDLDLRSRIRITPSLALSAPSRGGRGTRARTRRGPRRGARRAAEK